MSIEKVIIIIPTYNEESVIEETINAIEKVRESVCDFDIHVLVFDSASTDSTQSLVRKMQSHSSWLHLKTEPHKSGLGSAYLQAMRYALTELSADIVIEFDADLSHQPIYIAPMLEQIKMHDVVLGSRYIKNGEIPSDWGWHRKTISILGNQVARLFLTRQYKDFTSGFRLTRRAYLERALSESFLSNHYAYKLQLLWLLHKSDAKISEYPIIFIDRVKGQSKLPANSILDSLRVVFLLRLREIKQFFSARRFGNNIE